MADMIEPPHGANLLLSLFAGESDFPQIEGDLREEFHQILAASGPDEAKEWYWREAWRSAWALIMRPRVIHTLGSAALCVALFRLVTPFCFRWLRFQLASAPRVPGLRFVLIAFFAITAASILGGVVSRIWKGHESLLRLSFMMLYMLTTVKFILFSGIYSVWLSEPLRFAMDQFGLLCVIGGFWISSLMMEKLTGVARS